MNGPAPQRGPPVRAGFNPAVVTPSKPERWNGAGQAGRPNPLNARQNQSAIPSPAAVQGRPTPGQGAAQNLANPRPSVPPQQPVGLNVPQTTSPSPRSKGKLVLGDFRETRT
jgi:hypothetical protein